MGATGACHGRQSANRTAPQRGRPRRPPSAQGVRVLTIRVPEELLHRLDAYTAQMQAAQPYLRLSRADVLRMLLDKGLRATSCGTKETTAC